MRRKEAGDSDGDPRAFFNDILNTLRLPDTDILVIIDCCFAAKAFAHGEMGKRKFELLASAPSEERARSPKHEGSFTRILADILDDLLDHPQYGKGFSTSKLYREVYHNAKLKIKPYLFDQSRYDYGKIWLMPLPTAPEAISQPNEQDITIDLTLHLTEPPDGLMINQLAKCLQYLPHVEEVDFTRLHAPEKDIKSLISSMKRLRYLVRWIRRGRTRQREKATLNLERQGVADKRGQSFFALLEKQHNSSLYNWNDAFALLKNGTSIPVREPANPKARRNLTQTSQYRNEQPLGFKVHYFLGLFSVAYSLDLRSTKSLMTRLFTAPHTEERRASVDAVGHRPPGLPLGHVVDDSNPDMHVPSMVSVVDQAMEHHTWQTSSWDTFTWAVIVLGLACLCHVTRE